MWILENFNLYYYKFYTQWHFKKKCFWKINLKYSVLLIIIFIFINITRIHSMVRYIAELKLVCTFLSIKNRLANSWILHCNNFWYIDIRTDTFILIKFILFLCRIIIIHANQKLNIYSIPCIYTIPTKQ